MKYKYYTVNVIECYRSNICLCNSNRLKLPCDSNSDRLSKCNSKSFRLSVIEPGHCTYTALLQKPLYEAQRLFNDSCYGYWTVHYNALLEKTTYEAHHLMNVFLTVYFLT